MAYLSAPSMPDPAQRVRPSARVATVAGLLDCHHSDIRRLVARGELQAHTKGKRGIRVYLDSVAAYQERQELTPMAPVAAARRQSCLPTKSSPATRAYRAALEGLKAKGLA